VKKYLLILVIGVAVYGFVQYAPELFFVGKSSGPELSIGDKALENAFKNKRSNIQVRGSGKVIRILPDDMQGIRHQRFIIELNSGQTLLIAYNIDVAPRINNLNVGDYITFCGEYEWNAKGGVVHWTHHDPSGRHVNGWLTHGGKLYQ